MAATVPRSPLIFRTWPAKGLVPQDWIDQTGIQLLAAPVNDPAAYEYGNPFGPRQRNQDWVQPTNIALYTGTVPIDPIADPAINQYGNPFGPRQRNQDWIQSSNIALTAVVVATLPPGIQSFDLPPRAPRQPISNLTHTDSFKLPLQQVIQPNQYNWPIPRGPLYGRADWVDYILPWAQAPPKTSFGWPNPPLGARRNPQDWIQPTNIALNAVVAAPPPPTNYDWPNPRRALPPRQDWIFSTNGPLVTFTFNPAVLDWANPERPRERRQDWIASTNLALTVAPAATFQIAQYDWPNPRGLRQPVRDWSDSFKLPLQQVIQPNQYDWPNPPRAARRNPQDWQQSTSIALSFIQSPLNNYDWPNPSLGPRSGRQGWVDYGLPLIQAPPSTGFDWPNPRGPKQPVRDWTLPIPLPAATFVQPPILSKDWPNPRGPIFPISLRGFLGYPQILSPAIFGTDLAAEMLKNEVTRILEVRNESGRVILLKNEIIRGAGP